MFNKILRIKNKILYYLNFFIGKIFDFLNQIKLINRFPFKIISTFGGTLRIQHNYPVNFKKTDSNLFNEWKEYDTFPLDLYFVNNVRVTYEGIVLKKRSSFVKAMSHPIFRNEFGLLYNYFSLFFYKKSTKNTKKYLLIYDHWSRNNYYHWIIDSVCRLYLTKKHLEFEYTLLISENSPSYILESLKKFNIKNIEFIPPNCYFQIKDLYVMNYAAWSGQQHPIILMQLKNYLVSDSELDKINISKKIYVSRANQKSRRVDNEKQVVAIVKKYGFEVVFFENMSFENQVSLMRDVRCLVTSHGANLTNILFMPKDAKVLELIRDNKPNFCYWSLASSIGLKYYYQLCSTHNKDHLFVDTKQLINNLDTICKV